MYKYHCSHFLNYCANNLEAEALYIVSDTILLHSHSDASQGRSQAVGYKYLGINPNNRKIINRPVSIIAKIRKGMMSSVAEAEIVVLCIIIFTICNIRKHKNHSHYESHAIK